MSCQLRIKSISQPISDQGDRMNVLRSYKKWEKVYLKLEKEQLSNCERENISSFQLLNKVSYQLEPITDLTKLRKWKREKHFDICLFHIPKCIRNYASVCLRTEALRTTCMIHHIIIFKWENVQLIWETSLAALACLIINSSFKCVFSWNKI